MVVHGLIHRGKLILAGRIYETFELYARQIVKCCRTFCILAVFLQKKMSCQFQLPLQGILLDFSLTSLPLKCTEVGHHVQTVTKPLPDQPDMSGKIWNHSNCLFILDLEFFQKLMNLSVISTRTFMNICEKRSELISRKMTNDDEWLWISGK